MTILDEILVDVRAEVAAAKQAVPMSELRARLADAPPVRDFSAALGQGGFGLIAEIKRRSPSVGPMRVENVHAAAAAYARSSHVRAVSILTNRTHFGMGIEDLLEIRANLPQPVLRKDFFIEEYQILEARAHGADAILLMANVLDAVQLRDFHQLARELGMEALFEIHTTEEIAILPESARVVGINSRKFKATSGFVGATGSSVKDFSLEMSVFDLVDCLPQGCLRVAESGLAPETISSVASKFHAALVGTSLLRDPRGVEACLADFEHAIEARSPYHEN
jgi:indole-3-glycerol phosphate synthase